MQWINVKDQWPPEDKHVLAIDEDGVMYVAYPSKNPNTKWDYSACCGCTMVAVYWMLLPEAPASI